MAGKGAERERVEEVLMHSLLHHTKPAYRLWGEGLTTIKKQETNEVWLTPSREAGRVLESISPCSTRN